MKDSRGASSKTLTFVTISFWAVTLKYLLAGVSWSAGRLEFASTFSGAAEYGAAVALVLGIWLGREATEKVWKKPGEGGPAP